MPNSLHAHRANVYAGVPLDRAAGLRKNAALLAEARAAADALVVPVWRSMNFVTADGTAPRAVLCEGAADWPEPLILLGVRGATPIFAADLEASQTGGDHPALAGREGHFADLRAIGPLMDGGEAALLAYARGIVWWNARTRFCGVCGAPTEALEAGFMRRCANPACNAPHFPRTDPAVIMLVHDGGDRVLLGRQRMWTPGMYSVLAGFVEPGESLEEAVAREVWEETGVKVGDVRYHSSQPWPFPSSLMLGFTALALTTELTVDMEELETALWVERSRLRSPAPDDPLLLPRLDSIARHMLTEWMATD